MTRNGHRLRGQPETPGAGVAAGDSGQATVELALVIPFLALLVIGLVEVARLGALQVAVVDAARAGARAAAVDPRPAVAEQAATGNTGAGSVAVTTDISSGPPSQVTVQVTRTVDLVPGLGWSAVELEGSSTMAVEEVD